MTSLVEDFDSIGVELKKLESPDDLARAYGEMTLEQQAVEVLNIALGHESSLGYIAPENDGA